jgi:protein-glutamine gamma-glutamyltransferase
MAIHNDPSRRDLASLNRIAKEIYGEEAQIRDRPIAGEKGKIEKKDRFEYVKDGRAVSTVVGVTRTEDLVFRQNVVEAAYALAESGAAFSAGQATDKVNKKLWTLGYGGRMQVRKFLPEGKFGKPSEALNDIFENGKQYGFECATAMMVIYHKAILDHVGADAFDQMFTEPRNLTFFRWSIEDDDYTDIKRLTMKPSPLHPGSHYYFKNPDASAENSAFGGENVIYLGEGKFYAHGIHGADGTYIVTENEITHTLSSLRRRGATEKPYRVDMEMHMDGLALSKLAVPDADGIVVGAQ